jgi:hypothetical protein
METGFFGDNEQAKETVQQESGIKWPTVLLDELETPFYERAFKVRVVAHISPLRP